MAEIIALWIVCKNIGAIARSRGLPAQPFQMRAVLLWFAFELVCAFIAAGLGMQGILLYVAAYGGALFSLTFSFKAVREAVPRLQSPAASEAKISTPGT